MIKSFKREATFRQYTTEEFRDKIEEFYQFIEDFTYIDEELNPEERQQLLQSRFTNGYTPFLQLVRRLFGYDVQTQDIKAVFRKIATNPDVQVDWGEIFGINSSATEDVQQTDNLKETEDVFTLDSKIVAGQAGGDRRSRENIKCITHSDELNLYVTVTLHGIACHWNRKESGWVTGCCILPDLRLIANLFHIKPIDSPQCMTRVPWKSNPGTEDYILFGDEQGYVSLMTLNVNDFQKTRRQIDQDHDDPRNIIDPSELASPIIRRKFHSDWVMQIKYFPELQMFGSCSSADKERSFILSRLDNLTDNRLVREMPLPKGVNCFVYCIRANVIVTGGVDKILRIWHPIILTRPTGKLIGHLFTVTDISVNERDQHLISLSTARIFRIWDIQKMQCLQNFAVGENLTAENRTCVMRFDSKYDRLITGTNIIELWPLFRDQDSQVIPHTHEQSISCMLYNDNLNQMVSACTECILKVWEMETGQLVYTIAEAHGSKSIHITAMTTDVTGHRLITADQDGSLRLWDCISSQLLKSYNPAVSQKSSVSGISYQEIRELKYIFVATASRGDCEDSINELHVLCDTVQIQVQHVRFGSTPELLPRRNKPLLPIASAMKKKDNYLGGIFLSSDITCMDTSPTDNLLAAGFSNGSVFIWNTEQQGICSRISKQQLSQSTSYANGWNNDSISCLKFLTHQTSEPAPDVARSRRSTAVPFPTSPAQPPGSGVDRQSNASNVSFATGVLASATHNLSISAADDSASNKRNETQQQAEEEIAPPQVPQRTIILLICSENGCVSLATTEGRLLMQTTVANAVHRTRCITAVRSIAGDMQLFTGDTMGYLTCWNLAEFWKVKTEMSSSENDIGQALSNKEKELENSVEHTLTWRAHLMRVTNLEHIKAYNLLLSASIDGSVRLWHCTTGHFLGFFGQRKIWHLSLEMLIPPSPVQPVDITEAPLKPLKRLRLTNYNAKPEAAKCQLVFDNKRWMDAPDLEIIKEKESPRDKKFFSSLSKPKHYNSHLENSAVKAFYDRDAVFRTLPVYKVQSPNRLKTPYVNMREPTWFGSVMRPIVQQKRKRNPAPYRLTSPKKEVKPVVRFPHIVNGKRRVDSDDYIFYVNYSFLMHRDF
eukprot:gene20031-21995_t